MNNNDFLIDGIRMATINSTVSFMDKFPILRTILSKSKHPSSDWDFFMVSAGVGIYFLTNKSYEKEADEITNQLSEIDKQMPDAVHDFFNFIRAKETSEELTFGIGTWVLWNIMGEKPTLEECKELAPTIGKYLLKVVSDLSN